MRPPSHSLALIGALLTAAVCFNPTSAQDPRPPSDPRAARIDPYVARQRVVVMMDIANEPDDQMSMVRFLVYANQYDVEGLVATTSTWMRTKVRPDVIHALIDAYRQVQPKPAETSAWVPGRRSAEGGRRGGAARLRDGRGGRRQDVARR